MLDVELITPINFHYSAVVALQYPSGCVRWAIPLQKLLCTYVEVGHAAVETLCFFKGGAKAIPKYVEAWLLLIIL